jgi:drug/metabolite transporter (DMT)-like permease
MSTASWARLGLLACMWGSSFLLIALALDGGEGLTPIQIVLGRLTAGTAVLALILVIRRLGLPREPIVWLHLAAMGVVANIIPFFLFGWGQERITSGLAGVLNGSTPLFTLAIAIAALPEERLRLARAVGLLLGFLGVVVVVGPWDANPLTSSVPGQLACLGAAALYGVALVYTRRNLARRGYPPVVLATGQLGVATVLLWLAAPVVARGPIPADVTVLGAVVALGAVGTGLAYLIYYRLISEVGATSASMVTYLIPIVAVTLGVVVLGEPVGWNLFAGAALVILGVACAEGRLPLPGARPGLPPPESGAPMPADDLPDAAGSGGSASGGSGSGGAGR